jgi:CRP-like cAMP-binding protein
MYESMLSNDEIENLQKKLFVGASFGESALHQPRQPRDVTMIAIEDTELVELFQSDYRRIIAEATTTESRERLIFCSRLPIFAWCTLPELTTIASSMSSFIHYPRLHVIIHQGDVSNCLYFLVTGHCRVIQRLPARASNTAKSTLTSSQLLHHIDDNEEKDDAMATSLSTPGQPITTGSTTSRGQGRSGKRVGHVNNSNKKQSTAGAHNNNKSSGVSFPPLTARSTSHHNRYNKHAHSNGSQTDRSHQRGATLASLREEKEPSLSSSSSSTTTTTTTKQHTRNSSNASTTTNPTTNTTLTSPRAPLTIPSQSSSSVPSSSAPSPMSQTLALARAFSFSSSLSSPTAATTPAEDSSVTTVPTIANSTHQRMDMNNDGSHRLVELGRIHPPMCFGEIGIVRDVPRTAFVYADTPVTVLSMPRDAVMNSMFFYPLPPPMVVISLILVVLSMHW